MYDGWMTDPDEIGRRRRTGIALLTLLLIPLALADPDPPDAPDPAQPLQGVWKGRDTGNLHSLWTLQVMGNEFRFDGPGPQEWYEGTFALHDSSPAGIDLRILRCDCTYRDSTSLGLYALDGDLLTFVGAEPGYDRPEGFDLRGRTMQMHLQRLPPPD